jgi:hypothetical protein
MTPQEGKVKIILNEAQPIRSGYSEKTKKNWSIYNVELEDGTEVQVFGPVRIGDLIKDISFNDQYNVTQGQVARPDKHEEVMKALQFMATQNKEILRLLRALAGEDAPASAPPPKAPPARSNAPQPPPSHPATEPDVVVEDIGDEPINLDDIPF